MTIVGDRIYLKVTYPGYEEDEHCGYSTIHKGMGGTVKEVLPPRPWSGGITAPALIVVWDDRQQTWVAQSDVTPSTLSVQINVDS